MPFEKGHPKYGGRKSGTPSRAKMRVEEVKATFLRMNVNPIERLCKIAKSRTPVPEHILKALTELCKYYAPRLSTQTIDAKITGDIHMEAALHRVMVEADQATLRALEQLSLTYSRTLREAEVIDVEPVELPAASPASPSPVPTSADTLQDAA